MNESASLPSFHVVGFSGHRHLADAGKIGARMREVLADLKNRVSGEWIALSSTAAGSDQLFAREALDGGFAWHAILPLPVAEFRRDFNATEWSDVEALLGRAEHLRVLGEAVAREDAYLDAGMETVNECDVLLVVWDGEAARGKGGTGDVVDYARALSKPLVIIDAETGEVRRENSDFRPGGDAESKHAPDIAVAPDATTPVNNAFGAPESVVSLQRNADHAASRGAPQFRRLIVFTVLLHVLATLVAAAALAFGWHALIIPWVKLLCLTGALTVALVLRAQRTHHRWVRCRLLAEFCRSALAAWGLPRAAPLFAELDLPGLGHLTRSLQILHHRTIRERPVEMSVFKTEYIARRIDDQATYYNHKLGLAEPLLRRLRSGFWISTVLAIVCTGAYAVDHTWHLLELTGPTEELIYYFLPISAPVIAASFMSLIAINDLHRRMARYREMHALLHAARKQIQYCQTWSSLERIVRRTERALLQEVIEWHSITSFAESH